MCDGSRPARPESFLPLKAPVFHALIALGRGDRHGYALLREIDARSGGVVTLLPAALYRHLQRMLDNGLIEESPRRPKSASDDARRRYYRITTLGRRVADAEVRRLEDVLAQAKADLRPATAGAIVGVALSLGAGRFIQNFLFNTAPTDPAAMTAAGNRAASRWNRRCVGPGSPRCSHQSGPRPAGGLARNTK